MKKKIVLMGMLFLLTACSGKSQTTVCSSNLTGQNQKVTVEYNKEKDTVQEIVYVTTVDLKATGYTEATIKVVAEEYQEKVKDVKGVTLDYEIKDGKYTDTLTIDFAKGDLAEIQKLGFIQSSESGSQSVSYKKTIENFKALNMKCE